MSNAKFFLSKNKNQGSLKRPATTIPLNKPTPKKSVENYDKAA